MPLVRKHRSPPAVDRVVQDLDRALAATIASPGPEEVHALRVALKRVRSLLRLGRHTPGCRTPERIRRRLDRLFELAGRVRDRHVLLALLANEVPTRTSFALFRKRLMKDAPKADARLQRALRRHERVVEEVHTALADGLGRSGPAAWRRALVKAMRKAIALYGQPEWVGFYRRNGMTADFSWDRTRSAYEAVYRG